MERQTAGNRCTTDLRGESSAITYGLPKINAGEKKYPVSAVGATAAYHTAAKESTSISNGSTTSEGAASARQTTTDHRGGG